MKKVKLYGKLGKEFGKVHYFDVKNAAEAFRALCANYPSFYNFLYNRNDIGYRVLIDNVERDIHELYYPADKEIKIIPVVVGANDEARLIIGIAIVAVAVVYAGPAGLAAAGWLTQTAAAIGFNLALSGVVGIMTPVPTAPESPEKIESFGFNGSVNNVRQGGPVPLAYGELIVGSHVISAGISTEEIFVPPPPPPPEPPESPGNGFDPHDTST
jgi:predicted phage tail protein